MFHGDVGIGHCDGVKWHILIGHVTHVVVLLQVKPVTHSKLKVPGRIASIATEVICIK